MSFSVDFLNFFIVFCSFTSHKPLSSHKENYCNLYWWFPYFSVIRRHNQLRGLFGIGLVQSFSAGPRITRNRRKRKHCLMFFFFMKLFYFYEKYINDLPQSLLSLGKLIIWTNLSIYRVLSEYEMAFLLIECKYLYFLFDPVTVIS